MTVAVCVGGGPGGGGGVGNWYEGVVQRSALQPFLVI